MKALSPRRLALALRLAVAAPALPMLMLVAAASSTLLVACDDENEPKTWVKRLDDPAQRAAAIKRITQFFEDDMTKANKNREDPAVKALLDDIADPMTKQYTAGNLDEKTRKELMKFLSDTRDPRTGPAIAKAFNEYEPGKNDEDVKYAAQAAKGLAEAKKLTDQNVKDSLWSCFSKFQVSKAKSINLVTDLHDAVLAVSDPSYGPKAVEKLAAPIDPKNGASMQDQVSFWQLTAIQVIGNIKFVPGIKPLVTALLTPTKVDLRAPINTALLKMGKDSEPVLIGALSQTDPGFASQEVLWGEQKAWVAVLADSLGWISRPAGRDAVITAIGTADNDTNRTVLAQSLVKWPTDARSTAAYLGVYNKLAANTSIDMLGGANAHGALTQASAQFYDPTLVDWLLKEISSAKGEEADEMQLLALESCLKLMTPAQKAAVNAMVQKEGTPREKDMFTRAAAVLDKCNQDVGCYEGVLDQPVPTSPPTAHMTTIKAAYMAAIFGKDATRTELANKIDKVKDGGTRLAMVEAIDHLAPKGDVATATILEKIVDADTIAGSAKMFGDDAVAKVALRLRSRAE